MYISIQPSVPRQSTLEPMPVTKFSPSRFCARIFLIGSFVDVWYSKLISTYVMRWTDHIFADLLCTWCDQKNHHAINRVSVSDVHVTLISGWPLRWNQTGRQKDEFEGQLCAEYAQSGIWFVSSKCAPNELLASMNTIEDFYCNRLHHFPRYLGALYQSY